MQRMRPLLPARAKSRRSAEAPLGVVVVVFDPQDCSQALTIGRYDGPLDDDYKMDDTGDAVLTEHQKKVREAAKAAKLQADYEESIKRNLKRDKGDQDKIQDRVAAQGVQAEDIKEKAKTVGCLAHVCEAEGTKLHLRACLL